MSSLWKLTSVVWLAGAFTELLLLRYPDKILNRAFSFLQLNFIPGLKSLWLLAVGRVL